MKLDKNSIIEANDNPISTINVPEWGGEVYVKRPSIRERDALGVYFRGFAKAEKVKVKKGKEEIEELKIIPYGTEESETAYSKFRLYTVGYALCNEKGERLFSDEEIENILGKKSPEAIGRIFDELGNALNQKDSVSQEDSATA